MELKLYVVPGSHPCRTVEAALALKGLAYERVDLLPGLSQFAQLARFGKRTVPGLTADGNRVTGSLAILRYLDSLAPEPPLYPADPLAAAAAGEAERWGDEVLQTAARWIAIHALTRRPEAAESFMGDANLPQLPSAVSVPLSRVIFGLEARLIGGGTGAVERWLRELPSLLDHTSCMRFSVRRNVDLPHPDWSDERGDRAGLDGDRDVFNGKEVAVVDVEILDFDSLGHAWFLCRFG